MSIYLVNRCNRCNSNRCNRMMRTTQKVVILTDDEFVIYSTERLPRKALIVDAGVSVAPGVDVRAIVKCRIERNHCLKAYRQFANKTRDELIEQLRHVVSSAIRPVYSDVRLVRDNERLVREQAIENVARCLEDRGFKMLAAELSDTSTDLSNETEHVNDEKRGLEQELVKHTIETTVKCLLEKYLNMQSNEPNVASDQELERQQVKSSNVKEEKWLDDDELDLAWKTIDEDQVEEAKENVDKRVRVKSFNVLANQLLGSSFRGIKQEHAEETNENIERHFKASSFDLLVNQLGASSANVGVKQEKNERPVEKNERPIKKEEMETELSDSSTKDAEDAEDAEKAKDAEDAKDAEPEPEGEADEDDEEWDPAALFERRYRARRAEITAQMKRGAYSRRAPAERTDERDDDLRQVDALAERFQITESARVRAECARLVGEAQLEADGVEKRAKDAEMAMRKRIIDSAGREAGQLMAFEFFPDLALKLVPRRRETTTGASTRPDEQPPLPTDALSDVQGHDEVDVEQEPNDTLLTLTF